MTQPEFMGIYTKRFLSFQSLSPSMLIMLSQVYPPYALAPLIVWICVSLIRRLRSPIARIPGPTYTILTSLWLMKQEFGSNRRPYIHQLHQKYGPVVRLGPNEVSFTSLEAIKEIYTSGGSGYDKTEFYTLFMQFKTRLVDCSWRGGSGMELIVMMG